MQEMANYFTQVEQTLVQFHQVIQQQRP